MGIEETQRDGKCNLLMAKSAPVGVLSAVGASSGTLSYPAGCGWATMAGGSCRLQVHADIAGFSLVDRVTRSEIKWHVDLI